MITETLHFGPSSNPLLGIYHPASGQHQTEQAVLLCPSIGHEYIRSHWAMKRLANQLAKSGLPVLRFDYHGLGDSSLDCADVDSLELWQQDVVDASEELSFQSGCKSLQLVGLRMGAALAVLASRKISNSSSLVLWEPVFQGERFLKNWRSMHDTILDLWVTPTQTIADEGVEEILGSLYQRSLLKEIEHMELQDHHFNEKKTVLIGNRVDGAASKGPLYCDRSYQKVNDPDEWDDLRYLETAWLPASGPQAIVSYCTQSGLVGV